MSGRCPPQAPRGKRMSSRRTAGHQTGHREQSKSEYRQAHSFAQKQTTMSLRFSTPELALTHKARTTARVQVCTHRNTCVEAARLHFSTQQSRQVALVPFASLSAISGTFNSLFKVLFTFPSWYLFAIGLEPIFSFR